MACFEWKHYLEIFPKKGLGCGGLRGRQGLTTKKIKGYGRCESFEEIPGGTEIIGVQERPDKVIINLSSQFEYGGGTDSVYKRLFQLIKTARKNTEKPVYLYIDGRQADVIGGDGIMLTQPLSDNSLGG